MLSWLRRPSENAEWIAVGAETLIRDLDVALKGAFFLRRPIREAGALDRRAHRTGAAIR